MLPIPHPPRLCGGTLLIGGVVVIREFREISEIREFREFSEIREFRDRDNCEYP